MQVWIVLKNGKVDEVFSNEASARNHARNANKRWSIAEVITRWINDL